jgi:hypothetical protein
MGKGNHPSLMDGPEGSGIPLSGLGIPVFFQNGEENEAKSGQADEVDLELVSRENKGEGQPLPREQGKGQGKEKKKPVSRLFPKAEEEKARHGEPHENGAE